LSIQGVDWGNENIKIANRSGAHQLPANISPFRERKIIQKPGKFDVVIECDGVKKFAGTLAQMEGEWDSRKGGTKAHEQAKLRLLIALHLFGDDPNDEYEIIVGQPIDFHNEKGKIKELVKGSHEIIVNGFTKKITIKKVEVAVEGPSALMSNPQEGLIRVLDIGSGTINFGSLNNMRYVDRDSWTKTQGLATLKGESLEAIAEGIADEATMKWNLNDTVYVVGGGAKKLIEHLKAHFTNCELLHPILNDRLYSPIFANAIGFYEVGRKIYG
jgi:plasmid segregation protein ParM